MDESERIKKLEEELYSRNAEKTLPMQEHVLREKNYEVNETWKEDPKKESAPAKPKKNFNLYASLLLFSIIFFIGAGVYAYFSLKGGIHNVSSNNIDIEVSGPVSIAGGERLSLDVSVTNRNKVPLKVAELIIEYPSGTRSLEDSGVALPNERITIGDIEPGETARYEIGAILFGEEQSVANIKMILEYRLPNGTSIFEKELNYEIALNSNPISLNVESPKETISGQSITLNIDVSSNSNENLKNVIVEAEFPPGFSFVKSEPVPLSNNRSWRFSSFEPGTRKSIQVHGVLSGEDGDARTFRFNAGISDETNDEKLETAFAGYKQEIVISKPFLNVSLRINGKGEDTITVRPNDPVSVEVFYVNNLPVTLRNVDIQVYLSGGALDEGSIDDGQGFYQSATNILSFNYNSIDTLSEISPGQSGSFSFSLVPKGSVGQTPEVNMNVSVNALRGEDNNVPEKFANIANKKLLLQSEVVLNTVANFYGGPFENMGGVPPKAEKETTYSITWTLKNGVNDVTGAKVVATLPPYVKFIENVLPKSEIVTFSEVDRTITWNLGTLSANAGVSRGPRTVSFQIGVTPSISQVGSVIPILGPSTFTGEDRFSKVKVNSVSTGLTTLLIENGFKSGEEVVGGN